MVALTHTVKACEKCITVLNLFQKRQKLMLPLALHRSHNLTKRDRLSYYYLKQTRLLTTSATEQPTVKSTVDEAELEKFTKLAAKWWDERGEFYALHSMNRLRIPLIRDALVDRYQLLPTKFPLKDKYILDVGSGGGIVSEPLARLGARIVGIDMVEENIRVAQTHLMEDSEIMERIQYIHGAIEDLVLLEGGKFDAVISSEVVEHVSDVGTFISSCCKLLKPGGSLFITTLNKTYLSYGLAVFGAEQLLRVVPPGTHDWNKFVPPEDLQLYLENNEMTVKLLHGICYNPVINKWSWISDTSVNYAVHAVKNVNMKETE